MFRCWSRNNPAQSVYLRVYLKVLGQFWDNRLNRFCHNLFKIRIEGHIVLFGLEPGAVQDVLSEPDNNIFANVITIFHICNSGEPKGEGLDRAAYETVGKGLEGLVTIGAHTGVGAFEDGAGA